MNTNAGGQNRAENEAAQSKITVKLLYNKTEIKKEAREKYVNVLKFCLSFVIYQLQQQLQQLCQVLGFRVGEEEVDARRCRHVSVELREANDASADQEGEKIGKCKPKQQQPPHASNEQNQTNQQRTTLSLLLFYSRVCFTRYYSRVPCLCLTEYIQTHAFICSIVFV